MALITDPDLLNQGTEVVINWSGLAIQLRVAGNLSKDGVTLKCLYSFLKEEWKADTILIKFPFAMTPITDEQFELVNGWNFVAGDSIDNTRKLIRTGGWALKDTGGVSQEEYAGIITLGSVGAGDNIYYQLINVSGAATDFVYSGVINEAVKVYGDVTHGNFDSRSYVKLFSREYAKTYAQSTLTDIGVTTVTYQEYRFPVANATDPKITHTDFTVSGTSPYTGMSITWYDAAQLRNIGASPYNFHVIINGNNGTAEQIYEFVQYKLRLFEDIDSGSPRIKVGRTTDLLLRFVGDTLYTLYQTQLPAGGVFIDNYQNTDVNRLVFADDTGTNRTFPYVAALRIDFGDNLINDLNAIYRVFFTNDDPPGDNLGRDFGTVSGMIVNDAASLPMAYLVSGQSFVTHTYDYDFNDQRGTGSKQTDVPITVVAIGLNTAQYVKTTGTIQRSTTNAVSLVAALERNYQNP
jgi:hypothetical protein